MTAARSARHLLIAAAIFLCLLWQSLVLQTHIHLPRIAAPPAASGPSIGIAGPAASDDEADCVLCRELAQSGDYLVPTAGLLPAPAASFLLPAAVVGPAWPRRHVSTGWQGRAPPPPLRP